jgi:drug/metabolite transporter (DMT)-like permease
MIGAYGVANLLQSFAAARTSHERRFHPSLLLRLASHRTYLLGLAFQLLGFLLAFFARRELPLFLVQASVAAGLGVTAVLGMVVLKWRLPAAELVLLALLTAGITGLVISAEPAPSRQLGLAAEVSLGIALLAIAVAGFFAVRLRGAPGSVALGSLAGLAFGAAAIASRPLANVHKWHTFIDDPLLYLLIAHSIVGQLLLGLAMQRGSTTAAVAAMDAASAVPAAVVGLLMLGDRIWPGREWLAALGFLATLAAVIALTRYAEPQHHRSKNGSRSRRRAADRVIV